MSFISTNRMPSTAGSNAVPYAVIDIGATSIRMAIAEIVENGEVRHIETLSQAVSLGKDTFTQQRIRKASIESCVKVLKSYRRLMREYQILRPEQMRVVATSAVREATNRLAFIDRIFIATGLEVEPLDEAEVNRITYMGVQPLLKCNPKLSSSRTLIVEVGSGSTEILVVRGSNVIFSNSYRLGSLRLLETLEKFDAPRNKQRTIMEGQIQRFVDQIAEQVSSSQQHEIVAIGGDMRFAASNLLDSWQPDMLAQMPTEGLEALVKQLLKLSQDQIAQRYGMSFQDAETVTPALLSYVMLARKLNCTSIYVAGTNLRDGLLNDLAKREVWTAEFRNQIIRSALGLARKFSFDEKHARHVAQLSRKLFADLESEHQLDQRMELLLYLAALLHEIGLYINVRSNHKHAMYIIQNSELFGLSRKDVLLVSLVARYHRRSSPKPEHEGYGTLPRADRVVVAKLASILRLALALDESRSQRISHIRCRKDGDRIIITATGVEDVSLEQLALRQNANLFEETFGLSILLRSAKV